MFSSLRRDTVEMLHLSDTQNCTIIYILKIRSLIKLAMVLLQIYNFSIISRLVLLTSLDKIIMRLSPKMGKTNAVDIQSHFDPYSSYVYPLYM